MSVLLRSFRFLLLTLSVVYVNVALGVWRGEESVVPFDFSQRKPVAIQPLEKASHPWKVCALYPHLKDSYWLSVNYGMVDQARRLGIHLKVMAGDGYVDGHAQEQQLKACQEWHADTILLGGVGYNLLESQIETVSKTTPVFGIVNNISPKGVAGKVGVDWYQMGYQVGRTLTQRHPRFLPDGVPAPEIKAAWFSSPTGRGGSDISLKGLKDGLAGSAVKVVVESYGDNDHAVKQDLVYQVLESNSDVRYLIGGAVMAEVAICELARRGNNTVKVVATYMSHGVYRGILRGRIDLGNDDHMVLQGRMSVDQAVKYLEGKPWVKDFGPEIIELSPAFLSGHRVTENTLSPANWRPVYEVKPAEMKTQATSAVNK